MNDDIRNALIAITAGVPAIGGTLSFLLDKYLPSEAEKRRLEFLRQVGDDIAQIKEKIDIKNLETPEFQAIFTRLLRGAIEEYRQEKLVAFRNIAINVITNPNRYNFNQADFYSRLVLMLIPDQIKLLHLFYRLDILKELKEYDSNPKYREIRLIIFKIWGDVDKEYIDALLTDCARYSLISASPNQKKTHNRGGYFLTSLGIGFVEYIFEPIGMNPYGK